VLYRYREVPGSQSRDPAKRRIGAANARRARLAALARRGVGGRRRLLWTTAFLADYVAATSPRARVRAAATRVLHALGRWLAPDR
jgi:hypothetical protein